MLWARVEKEDILEYTDSDPEGSYHKEVRWVLVPTVLETLGYRNLKCIGDEFFPVSDEDFDEFLLRKVLVQVEFHLYNMYVKHKGITFPITRELLNELTTKYVVGKEVESTRYRERYNTMISVDNKCFSMNLKDIITVLTLADQRKTVILTKQSEIQKAILATLDYEEKVCLALSTI